MGPPDFSGGIGVEYRLTSERFHDASMGPPDFSGGINAEPPAKAEPTPASMGPPDFSGGISSNRSGTTVSRQRFNGAA